MISEHNPEPPPLSVFLSLERSVWQALVDGDATADAALLAPDFLGVYPSGFSDKAGHVGQLATGPTIAQFELSQTRIMGLGADQVLFSYRADFTRVGRSDAEQMYVSSLWVRRGAAWVNVFSQDTPAAM